MRNPSQVAVRQKRVEIANELILWMKDRGHTHGIGNNYPDFWGFGEVKGSHNSFEVWRAWDILKEAGRVNKDQRQGWKLLDSTPIQLDANGDIRRN